MNVFYKEYLTKIVNYDLLNKFNFKMSSELPVLEHVVLKFDFKTYDYNSLLKCLTVLKLLTGNNCSILKSKNSSTFLKLKKGVPIGCKVNLKKNKALNFLLFLINNKKLTHNNYKVTSNSKSHSVTIVIANILSLDKLQENYHFFKNITNLNLKFVITTKDYSKLKYLLNCYKF